MAHSICAIALPSYRVLEVRSHCFQGCDIVNVLGTMEQLEMESTVNLENAIADKIKALSSDRQKQVLDFVEFLLSQDNPKQELKKPRKEFKHPDGTPMSALEVAKDFVGCIEGPGDLSMKKQELKHDRVSRIKRIKIF